MVQWPSMTRPLKVCLASYKQLERGPDSVNLGEIFLIDRQAEVAARVDVEERLAEGYVAEGLDERQHHLAVAQPGADLVPARIAQLEKLVGLDVGDQISEGRVERDDVTRDALLVEPRRLNIQPDQFLHFRTHPGPIVAARQMRADRGEDVAAVKRGRNRLADHPRRIGDRARSFDPVAVL